MTTEPPPPPSRRARPGADARRRALGLEPPAAAPSTADPSVVTSPPTRESLVASLARIPDLDRAGAASPADATPDPGSPSTAGASAPMDATGAGHAPVQFDSPIPAAPSRRERRAKAEPDAPAPSGRSRPPMWRRVAFAVVLVALVASIPVLGVTGAELISQSTAGNVRGDQLGPEDPGYEARVEATPTAVAIQFDDEGTPNGVTFMALSGVDGGGSVVFVPLDTEVDEPSFGVDKLRTAYRVVSDRPTLARERLASQVGRLLNVGVEEIIDLNDDSWEQLVAPVAPLTIDNPDEIMLADGTVLPTGEVTIEADQVGPYLAAGGFDGNDLNRMNRHDVLWRAWMDAVRASGAESALPGESTAGIGRYARVLAAGPVAFDTLPVEQVQDAPTLYRADRSAVRALVTDAVASPTAAVPGSRFNVRLLNGVAADAIPGAIVRQVVGLGGAVTVLGNGPSFDTDETIVVYGDPADEGVAELVASTLGATGEVRLDREAPDTVALTIVLGRDILGDSATSGLPGSTAPELPTTTGGS